MRGRMEEMGFSYATILKAVQTGAIAQPETGKFTLPDHKPQPSNGVDSRPEIAAENKTPASEPLSLEVPVIISLSIKAGKNPKRGLTISGRAGDGKPIFIGDLSAADLEPMPRALRVLLSALVKSHARVASAAKAKPAAGKSKKKARKK